VENSGPTIWPISEIFEKLPKQNNRRMGEKSPNLVTLLSNHAAADNRGRHFDSTECDQGPML
jgi:hypothetical protein